MSDILLVLLEWLLRIRIHIDEYAARVWYRLLPGAAHRSFRSLEKDLNDLLNQVQQAQKVQESWDVVLRDRVARRLARLNMWPVAIRGEGGDKQMMSELAYLLDSVHGTDGQTEFEVRARADICMRLARARFSKKGSPLTSTFSNDILREFSCNPRAAATGLRPPVGVRRRGT